MRYTTCTRKQSCHRIIDRNKCFSQCWKTGGNVTPWVNSVSAVLISELRYRFQLRHWDSRFTSRSGFEGLSAFYCVV